MVARGTTMGMKRGSLLLGITAIVLALVPAHAQVTPVDIECALSGSATFTPGVKALAQPIHYSFTGKLSPCKNQGTPAKSATVSATGSGKFGCLNGSSSGLASVRWNIGQTSTVSFKTSDVGALVKLSGAVTSGYLRGITFNGLLAFEANPIGCVGGLATAKFNGVLTTK
jgi:hypothetical protein